MMGRKRLLIQEFNEETEGKEPNNRAMMYLLPNNHYQKIQKHNNNTRASVYSVVNKRISKQNRAVFKKKRGFLLK